MTATPHSASQQLKAASQNAITDYTSECTIEALATDHDIESVADEWDRLFHSLADAQPYLHRAWVTAWRSAAPSHLHTCILAVRKEGTLSGLFPLQVARYGPLRVARPVGTGLPSYLGILADPLDSETLEALAQAVLERQHFDLLITHDVYSRDLATNMLLDELSQRLAYVVRRHRARTHLIRLSPTFDEYLQMHSAKSRQTLRRKRRKLESAHDICIHRFDGACLDTAAIARIAEIQRASWMRQRGADVFSGSFFRELIDRMARVGLARAWVLTVNGRDAAFMLALCAGDSLIYKWTAFTLEHADLSVGQYLTAATIQDCCERGVRWYDFSHGEAAYKSFWSTDTGDVSRVIVGSGLRGKAAARCLASLWHLHQAPATQFAIRTARSIRARWTRR